MVPHLPISRLIDLMTGARQLFDALLPSEDSAYLTKEDGEAVGQGETVETFAFYYDSIQYEDLRSLNHDMNRNRTAS